MTQLCSSKLEFLPRTEEKISYEDAGARDSNASPAPGHPRLGVKAATLNSIARVIQNCLSLGVHPKSSPQPTCATKVSLTLPPALRRPLRMRLFASLSSR